MTTALSESHIDAALANLPGWSYENDKLHRHLEFGSFREAMSFIVRISYEAEAMNHHPELYNVYNKVDITLSTHDAGGKVTEKDIELAQAIHKINWRP